MHRLFALGLFVLATIAAGSAPAQTVPQTLPNSTNALGQPRPTGTVFVLNSNATLVDGSGAIATAATAQQVFTANLTRTMFLCQNPITATETLFVNLGATDAGPANGSIELAPGGTILLLGAAAPTARVTVYAATLAHRFVCKQQG